MGILAASDRAAGSVARAATTLGQLALVALGVHLAADQLDDRFVAALLAAQSGLDALLSQPAAAVAGAFGWEAEALQLWQRAPIAPLAAAGALAVEVAALTLFAGSFLLTERAPALTLGGWRRVRSVQAVVLPLALAGVLLAGSWSLAMAVEDVLPASPAAGPAAAAVALAALARFGWPAWRRAVAALDPARPAWDGALSALVLAPVGALAWVHGVPIWGLVRGVVALLPGGAP